MKTRYSSAEGGSQSTPYHKPTLSSAANVNCPLRDEVKPPHADHTLLDEVRTCSQDERVDSLILVVVDYDIVDPAVAWDLAEVNGFFEHTHGRGRALGNGPNPLALAGVVDRASLDLELPRIPLGVFGLDDEIQTFRLKFPGAFPKKFDGWHLRRICVAGCPHEGGADQKEGRQDDGQ